MRRQLAAYLTIGIFTTGLAVSQTTTWTGNEDGTSWSEAGNWNNGLPDPAGQARFLNSAAVVPAVIHLDLPQTVRNLNFANTNENHTYTFTGSPITLSHNGSSAPAINTSFDGEKLPITFNNDIVIAHIDPAEAVALAVSGNHSTITFNGDILTSGTGNRTFSISLAAGTMVINGANNATSVTFGGDDDVEVIAASSNALGNGWVQKTNAAMLSLRADVTVTGVGNSYSWAQTSANSYTRLRINEAELSTADRTLTFQDRIAGSNGAIEFVDNLNSTGNLILALGYSGGTAQSLPLITNETAVIRFIQTGNTTYSGLISGSGQLQVTGGGNTTLSAANTYSGATMVTSGNLILSGDGSLAESSGVHLAGGTTLSLAGIASGSYTFGSDQTLSGTGTVVGGGKNVVVQGTISPGNSAGTLGFALNGGTLTLGPDVSLVFDLGTESDMLLLSGTELDLGQGTLDFDSFTFQQGAGFGAGTYTLFSDADNLLGFLGGTVSGAIGGFYGSLELNGNDLLLNVIPEPGTMAFIGLTALLLGGRRRVPSA